MKKQFIICFLFLTFIFTGYSQMEWLRLYYPESDILGKVVLSFKDGNINYKPQANYILNPTLDVVQSADDITEYNQQLRNFITKYFTSNKYNVTEVKAKKLVIKSLNIDAIKNMEVGNKYVYSGISADSVEVTVKFKKEKDVDFSKIIKDVTGLITSEKATEIITKVIPLFDSISYHKMDSLSYSMVLANPNVYYKIKIVQFSKGSNHNWEGYWLSFNNPNGKINNDSQNDQNVPKAFNLIYSPLETSNSTKELYPEFWGKDRQDVKFRLIAKKDNNELKLFIQYTGGNFNNKWIDIEVKPKIVNDKKYWVLDRTLVYTFEFKQTTKLVYIQLRGEEINPDTIKITNWNSSTNDKLTFMQYPEVKFRYTEN